MVKFTKPVDGHWQTDEGTDMANEYADMSRKELAKANMTDLELANAIYMADRNSLDLLVWQTAAKERIRWLSVQLAIAKGEASSLSDRLTEASKATFVPGDVRKLLVEAATAIAQGRAE